jgi:predicted O-methyltransferase YrrM
MSKLRDIINRAARNSALVCRLHVKRSGQRLFETNPQWKHYSQDWYASRQPGRSSLSDRRPWLTYPAIEWLDKTDWAGKRIFEWGGGGSTLYFIDRGAIVTTIEHDPDWVEHLRRLTACDDTQAMDLNLIEPTETIRGADSSAFGSSKAQYQGASFEKYVRAIDAFSDKTFDLVVVDGRCRSACLQHAIAKVRPQGSLIFDNAERPEYNEAIAEYREAIAGARTEGLSAWTHHDLSGPTPYLWDAMSTTLAWTRPGSVLDRHELAPDGSAT